jgi:hypothetical protein
MVFSSPPSHREQEEVVRKRLMGLTGGVGIDTLVTIILADVLIFAFSVSEEAHWYNIGKGV